MKKIFVLALLSLASLSQAATVTCNGLLLAQKTKAFGGGEYVIEATNWKIKTDGSRVTLSQGQVSMEGTVKDGIAKLADKEQGQFITLSDIHDEDGNKNYIKVVGKTKNSGGLVVANISGELSCK